MKQLRMQFEGLDNVVYDVVNAVFVFIFTAIKIDKLFVFDTILVLRVRDRDQDRKRRKDRVKLKENHYSNHYEQRSNFFVI